MKSPVLGILFALAFIVSFVMAGYFFSLTHITLNSFLTINLTILTDSILNLNFLFFCISTSIGLGVLASIGSFYELKQASIISITGYVLSIIILIVAFNLTDFFVPLLAGLFAIPICYTSIKKSREMKVFPILRTGLYATNQFILIVGLAFFIILLVISITQASYLTNNFTKEMLATTVGENLTLSDQISLQLASSISAHRADTIDVMLSQKELENLVNEGSIDAINFKQKLLAYKAAYLEDDYKSKTATSLKNQNIDFGTELLNKFPILTLMAKYAFLLYPISAFILFIFIGNILIKNIAGLVFSAILKFIPYKEITEEKA